MMRAELILYGKVQNIGFRDFARRKAGEHKITGFVKNMPDGTLQIIAEGEENCVKKFVKECKRGPLLAAIKGIGEEYSEATGEFKSFEIEF